MIGNITEAERLALRLCAERASGAPLDPDADIAALCHCAKVWGYPKDAYPACAALTALARLTSVEAEGGQ